MMKNLFRSVMFVVAATMAFTSCSKDQENGLPVENEQGYLFSFGVEDNTRTSLAGNAIKWEAGDLAGVFVTGSIPPTANVSATIDLTKTPMVFNTTLKAAPAEGQTLYAYYPYTALSGANATAFPMSILTVQRQQEANIFNGANNPLVGLPVALTAADLQKVMPVVKFRQLGSIIEYKLFSTNAAYAAETVLSVAFTADKAMAGSFNVDLTAVSNTTDPVITGYTEQTITTRMSTAASIGVAKESASKIYMVVAPGTYSGAVTVTTDKAVYTFNITVAKDFKRAGIKELGVNLANADGRVARTAATYTKITSIDDLTTGEYIITATANATDYYAIPNAPNVITGKIAGQRVVVSNNTIQEKDAAGCVWTITKATGMTSPTPNNPTPAPYTYYTLNDGGQYLYHEQGGQRGDNLEYGMREVVQQWSVVYDANEFKFVGIRRTAVQRRGLFFNAATVAGVGSNVFGGYSTSGYKKLTLFKKSV
ncbi:MAG: fimbrillin family protein [Alistipes sp.]